MRHSAVLIAYFTAALSAVRAAPIDDLPAPIITRQTVFSIPFTVPPSSPSEQPAEVRLFASSDRGATWQFTDRVDLRTQTLPYKGGFNFRAPADGEYWFAIRTANRNSQIGSEKISVPELRVAVDTRPPRFDLSAKRGPAGEIIVSWQSVDPTLNAKSLQLQYQSTGNPRWQSIALDASAVDFRSTSLSSSATWWPVDASGIVTIRGEVTDAAGNAAVAQAQVDLQQSAPARSFANDPRPLTASMNRSVMNREHSTNGSAESTSRERTTAKSWSDNRSTFDAPASTVNNGFATGTQWPADTRTELPLGHGTPVKQTATSAMRAEVADDQRLNNGSSGPAAVTRPIEGPALGPSPDGRIRPSGQSLDRQQPSESGAPQISPARAGVESPVYPPVGSQYVPTTSMPQPTLTNRPAATTGSRPALPDSNGLGSPLYFDRGGAGATSAGDNATPRGARASGFDYVLPPGERLRMVNSTTFELDYDVELVGRSGIAKVELWMTRDGGRTWQSIGLDNDNRSPFRTTVDGEGVYGYRMTVQSGNGLGGRPPQSGDLPEVWIGVDLTRPSARLVSAEAGNGDRAGEIVIRYEANDALLASQPITLLRSSKPGGPWTTIAAGLENLGQYSWRFDGTVPDRVHLRLEARDEAGNIGAFEAADPISLERVLPQGRLREVRPIADSYRGATAAPQ